ncbi:MAG: Gfo/Idh/MocA family oxidoreductase [Proteobacteria bacterium]|nr:Gfo/Idh/MocA family oxidoreductase [Pseudomonadota bacterium]
MVWNLTTADTVTRLRKLIRFVGIYGIARTFYKVMGRIRPPGMFFRIRSGGSRSIGVVGCGQFAFANIGYFLHRKAGSCLAACYDPDNAAAASFSRFHDVPTIAATADEVLCAKEVELVYIASNHASHAGYSVIALHAGKRVYVEKPVAVNSEQLRALCLAQRETGHPIFAGYCRPFSRALRELRRWCDATDVPLTLSCFIWGHQLPADHWYRRPAEGTRICGNAGHWIDLMVHILHWGILPDRWQITLVWSNESARDDDLAITLVSERGDLVNIVQTARTEPFDGVSESIHLQWADTIAEIGDFRRMTIWKGAHRKRYRYWHKDVGHCRAILQPFSDARRDWREVELSTLLMIEIAAMVVSGKRYAEFSFSQAWESLGVDNNERHYVVVP